MSGRLAILLIAFAVVVLLAPRGRAWRPRAVATAGWTPSSRATWPRPTARSRRPAPRTGAGTATPWRAGPPGARGRAARVATSTTPPVLVDDRPGRERGSRAFPWPRTARQRPRGPQPQRGRLGRRAGCLSAARPGRAPGCRESRLSSPRTSWSAAWLADPDDARGLAWGKPAHAATRRAGGRPRGGPPAHARRVGRDGRRRSELRFLAFVHDSFKRRVQQWLPQTGREPPRDARPALRRALQPMSGSWPRSSSTTAPTRSGGACAAAALRSEPAAAAQMLARVPDRELFLRFMELDGSTEGKARSRSIGSGAS